MNRASCLLKVLMVGPSIHRKGGMAAVAGLFVNNWNNNRFDLKYIATVSDKPAGVKVLEWLRAALKFGFALLFWRPDIVHIHFSGYTSFYRKSIFVLLAKIRGVSIVMHCHSSRFDVFYDGSHALLKKLIRQVLIKADLILVVSRPWQAYFHSLSIQTPVYVLYNAIEIPESLPPYVTRKPIVLTLGRLGQRKGTYDIMEAIPIVVDACPDAEFWLAGDGDVEQISSLVSQATWSNHIQLQGWIQGQEKLNALQQARVFLLPSYHEGLPVAILEAMAHGLPVVSTPVGGIPEVVVEAETGFLIPPGHGALIAEKVADLLLAPVMAEQLGLAGRRLIQERHEISSCLQRLFVIYDDLLKGTNYSQA